MTRRAQILSLLLFAFCLWWVARAEIAGRVYLICWTLMMPAVACLTPAAPTHPSSRLPPPWRASSATFALSLPHFAADNTPGVKGSCQTFFAPDASTHYVVHIA
jgi:hypothetical protein